ncbi:MAG: hypothetical protein VX206_01875 [Pseudomonadota bacterium]|nr:hypothetical protein [Pseudomonadota bacterium]
MGRNNHKFLLVLLCIAMPGFGYSQQLNLFEEIETSNNSSSQARDRARGDSRATSASPEFVLIGTSRIGSEYSVIIQHRGGDILMVKAGPNSSKQIPGYNGYSIIGVGSGRVSIRYPESAPCVEFRDQGVNCDAAVNIAALSLANGEALPGQEVKTRLADSRPGEATADEPPINPFEALRAQQNNVSVSNRDGDNERFTPRRILPEDVPPGMRVVSTPFGDRLVEQ